MKIEIDLSEIYADGYLSSEIASAIKNDAVRQIKDGAREATTALINKTVSLLVEKQLEKEIEYEWQYFQCQKRKGHFRALVYEVQRQANVKAFYK